MRTTEPPAPQAAPGTPDVTLREMRWWDIDAVLGLEQRLFPEDAWSAGMFWSELAHARGPGASRRYLVAAAPDGDLVGYGGVGVVDGTGDILTIGVLPSHEGTGLGARLLTALLDAATTELACQDVLLEVRADNTRAQRLYRRFGFQPIGVRPGYYPPGNVDALVMRRTPGTSGTSGTPEIPGTSGTPATSEIPGTSEIPATPETLGSTATPGGTGQPDATNPDRRPEENRETHG